MKKQKHELSKIDTLFIIGNGFDIWQGLHTDYFQFRNYYIEHRDEILKNLHLKKKAYINDDGEKIEISDVEIVYGDPFSPNELEDDFWGTFETSLDNVDAERLNLFFDKTAAGLRQMKRSIKNAKRILREAFCRWIATIVISEENADYRFGSNCLFINFNYTDTLEKRFGVEETSVFHIHGEASDKESIIFGHSNHPQLPEEELYRLGGRFRGLYFVDNLLYETDKHVFENILALCMVMSLHAVMREEIKHIYVLGHSMSPPDIEYFAFLANAVSSLQDTVGEDEVPEENIDSLEELHSRMEYTIQHIGYQIENEKIPEEYKNAINRRRLREEAEIAAYMQDYFFKHIKNISQSDKSDEGVSKHVRTTDAQWHITYHGDKSKLWAERVMRELGCSKYRLYASIDDCLKPFHSIS